MTSPTVIFITHVVPYPPAAGNEIRILKLINWLKQRGYRIVLLLNVQSLSQSVREPLEKIVDGIHCRGEDMPDVELPMLDNNVGFFRSTIRRVEDLLTGYPLTNKFVREETNHVDPEYKKKAEAARRYLCSDKLKQMTYHFCLKYRPYAVVAEYIFTAPCFDFVPPGTLKLIDTHDMFSRKKDQVLSHGIEDPLHCTPAEERSYLLRSDVVIAIQEDEARMFRKLARRRKVVNVGIDYDVVSEIDNSHVVPDRVLVVGSDNPMNVHGLNEFFCNAWPLVKSVNPEATLRVIGKLGNKFQSDDSRVDIAGWVESLEEEYKKACVVINPTVAGTGLKIKCVEALCHAKPLVATPHSVEGLHYEDTPPFAVGRNWTEFADAIIMLLKSERTRVELQERAWHFARRNYSSHQVYAPLSSFFPEVGTGFPRES